MLQTPSKMGGEDYNFRGLPRTPVLSPAAVNLHKIHEAFRNGSITPQKKAELKDQLIESASKEFLEGKATMNAFQRQIFGIKTAQQHELPSAQSSPAIFRQQFSKFGSSSPQPVQRSPYRSPVQRLQHYASPTQCEAQVPIEPAISPSQLASPGMIPASLVGGVIRQARKDTKEMTRTGRDFFLRLNACEILDKPNLNLFQKHAEQVTTSYTARELRPGGRLPPLRQQSSATAREEDGTEQQRQTSAYEEALARKKERRRKRKQVLHAKRAQKQREQHIAEEHEKEHEEGEVWSPEPTVERFDDRQHAEDEGTDLAHEVADPELARGVCGQAVRYTTPCPPSKAHQGDYGHEGNNEDRQKFVDDNAVTFVVDGMGVVQAQSNSNFIAGTEAQSTMGAGLGGLGPQVEYFQTANRNNNYYKASLMDEFTVQEPDLSAKPKFCPATELLHELNSPPPSMPTPHQKVRWNISPTAAAEHIKEQHEHVSIPTPARLQRERQQAALAEQWNNGKRSHVQEEEDEKAEHNMCNNSHLQSPGLIRALQKKGTFKNKRPQRPRPKRPNAMPERAEEVMPQMQTVASEDGPAPKVFKNKRPQRPKRPPAKKVQFSLMDESMESELESSGSVNGSALYSDMEPSEIADKENDSNIDNSSSDVSRKLANRKPTSRPVVRPRPPPRKPGQDINSAEVQMMMQSLPRPKPPASKPPPASLGNTQNLKNSDYSSDKDAFAKARAREQKQRDDAVAMVAGLPDSVVDDEVDDVLNSEVESLLGSTRSGKRHLLLATDLSVKGQVVPHTWNCSACTFSNSILFDDTCQMCNTRSPYHNQRDHMEDNMEHPQQESQCSYQRVQLDLELPRRDSVARAKAKAKAKASTASTAGDLMMSSRRNFGSVGKPMSFGGTVKLAGTHMANPGEKADDIALYLAQKKLEERMRTLDEEEEKEDYDEVAGNDCGDQKEHKPANWRAKIANRWKSLFAEEKASKAVPNKTKDIAQSYAAEKWWQQYQQLQFDDNAGDSHNNSPVAVSGGGGARVGKIGERGIGGGAGAKNRHAGRVVPSWRQKEQLREKRNYQRRMQQQKEARQRVQQIEQRASRVRPGTATAVGLGAAVVISDTDADTSNTGLSNEEMARRGKVLARKQARDNRANKFRFGTATDLTYVLCLDDKKPSKSEWQNEFYDNPGQRDAHRRQIAYGDLIMPSALNQSNGHEHGTAEMDSIARGARAVQEMIAKKGNSDEVVAQAQEQQSNRRSKQWLSLFGKGDQGKQVELNAALLRKLRKDGEQEEKKRLQKQKAVNDREKKHIQAAIADNQRQLDAQRALQEQEEKQIRTVIEESKYTLEEDKQVRSAVELSEKTLEDEQKRIERKIKLPAGADWARMTAKDWSSQLNDSQEHKQQSFGDSIRSPELCRTLVVRSDPAIKWRCNVCTFDNDKKPGQTDIMKCQMCQSERILTPAEKNKAQQQEEQENHREDMEDEKEEEEEQREEEDEDEEEEELSVDETIIVEGKDDQFSNTHKFANGETVKVVDE